MLVLLLHLIPSKLITRVAFFFSLLVAFFLMFGEPAWRKYRQDYHQIFLWGSVKKRYISFLRNETNFCIFFWSFAYFSEIRPYSGRVGRLLSIQQKPRRMETFFLQSLFALSGELSKLGWYFHLISVGQIPFECASFLWGFPYWLYLRGPYTVSLNFAYDDPWTFICSKLPGKTAWKDGTASQIRPYNILKLECPKPSFDDLMDCVGRKLYNRRGEFDLTGAVSGTDLESKNVTWDMKYMGGAFGACHTFHYPYPTGTDPVKDSVQVKFDQKLSYNVYIHDPDFFLPTPNPSSFPSIALNFEEGKEEVMKSFYIEVILILMQRVTS